MKGTEPKCIGLEAQYVDYLKPPTRAEAVEMCEGCPLFDLCDAVSTNRKPAWGVWAGRVYGSMERGRSEKK